MKRKDFENAFDDDFSLSSAARKSRRLDFELAPIMEEESIGGVPDESLMNESFFDGADLVPNETGSVGNVANDRPSEELAIVLYDPGSVAGQRMVKSPSSSNLSYVMNPELLSGWKSHLFNQGNQSRLTITELDEESDEYKIFQSNYSMAVVPWMAASQQQHPYVTHADDQAPVMNIEPMEADVNCDMMEYDDDSSVPSYNNLTAMNNAMMGGAGTPLPLQQQQQPHCLIPQQNAPKTYTPIHW